MKDMPLKTPEQLGSAIRLKRMERGMSQVDLAGRLGVERKWIIKLEAGNPKAELGLILKALTELGLEGKLTASHARNPPELREPLHHAPTPQERTSRLDQVFERLGRRRK